MTLPRVATFEGLFNFYLNGKIIIKISNVKHSLLTEFYDGQQPIHVYTPRYKCPVTTNFNSLRETTEETGFVTLKCNTSQISTSTFLCPCIQYFPSSLFRMLKIEFMGKRLPLSHYFHWGGFSELLLQQEMWGDKLERERSARKAKLACGVANYRKKGSRFGVAAL
jgi:hypothetical protein